MLTRSTVRACTLAFLILGTSIAQAQRPWVMGEVTARYALADRGIPSVLELRSGGLLVSEATGRLLLLDSALRVQRTVVDSVPASRRINRGQLLRWRGDTALYLDGVEPWFHVIDPSGRVVGRRRVPRAGDQVSMRRTNGVPGIDRLGRIVFTGESGRDRDTVPLLAVVPEPFGAIEIMTTLLNMRGVDEGLRLQPIPSADAWAVLDDGAIAIVRATPPFEIERHVPGQRDVRKSAIPFEVLRLTPAQKLHIVDSVHRVAMAAANGRRLMAEQFRGVRIATEVVDTAELPDFLPPFTPGRAVSGPGTTLWLAETASSEHADSATVSILSGADSTLGHRQRIRLRRGEVLLGFGVNAAYFVDTGSFSVIRRRLSQ